jgi:hypothetical protein
MPIIDLQRDEARRLPCAHWCRICPTIRRENPREPDPCSMCHDCNIDLAAAEDATWD